MLDVGSATAANCSTAARMGAGRKVLPVAVAAASRLGSAGLGIAFSAPDGPVSPPRKPCTREVASSRVLSSAFSGMWSSSTCSHKEPGFKDAAEYWHAIGHGGHGIQGGGHRPVASIEEIAAVDAQLDLAARTKHLAQ